MYSQLCTLEVEQQVEMLTRHLVGIESINGTVGEAEVVKEIYRIL